MDAFVCFLDRWQTLFTGVLATLAAAVPIFYLHRQLRLQKAEFDAEQTRLKNIAISQNWSARAHLPDALSSMCDYAAECFARVVAGVIQAPLPTRPSEAITSVKQSIEHADPVSAKALYELVVHYQIHNSRFRTQNRNLTNHELAQLGYDSVRLRCLCNRLFSYGRNETEFVLEDRLTREMMRSAHMVVGGINSRLNAHQALNDAIEQLIQERHED